MVSEKLIISLIIVAIILSIASIAITLSTNISAKAAPQINTNENVIPDTDHGFVSITINKQPNVSNP